jgi:hypothetical protein
LAGGEGLASTVCHPETRPEDEANNEGHKGKTVRSRKGSLIASCRKMSVTSPFASATFVFASVRAAAELDHREAVMVHALSKRFPTIWLR